MDSIPNTPNPNLKGELTLDILGKPRKLKLTIQSLAELEDLLGYNITELAMHIAKEKIATKVVAQTFWAGIKGADPTTEVTWEDVGNFMIEHGVLNYIPIFVNFIMPALHAGPAKELKEAGEAQKKMETKT